MMPDPEVRDAPSGKDNNSEPTLGTLVVNMREAFPPDRPTAVFVVAISSAYNDLMYASTQLLDAPEDTTRLYLLRLSFSLMHEFRETVKRALHARVPKGADVPTAEESERAERVNEFVGGLPSDASEALRVILDFNRGGAPWINKTVEYVRNQSFHYGGEWGWDDLKWAMEQVADDEGEIRMDGPARKDMRLRFADVVATQHLLRHAPRSVGVEPPATSSAAVEPLPTLLATMAEVCGAAMLFVTTAVDEYLKSLPPGTVRVERHEESGQ